MPNFRHLPHCMPALLLVLQLAGCASGAINGVSVEPVPVVQKTTPVNGNPAAEPAKFEIREAVAPVPTIDLTAASDDVWERIRKGFAMPDLGNDLVTSQQVWYLNRPEHLKRVFERSRRYLYHIVEEIEKRGLPTELALLPMVESAFNPMAQSPAQASGLWQFIPSTGRSYGLEQNWWLDERRDIIQSTNAALEYLQYVYEMHGDWHLALASYNWGENAVARAIARNGAAGLATDYTSLSMPAETRNYVPKLQALKNIIAQPQLFGLAMDPIPNRPYFATIKKPADMDVAVAARLAETPVEEFRALNPAHNRPVMKSAGEAALVLPADKVDRFLSNLESHDKPLVSWQSYTVPRKERLDKVAARFGLSPVRLSEVNGISPGARVPAGYTLLVPARNGSNGVIEFTDTAVSATAQYEAAHPGANAATGYRHGRETRLVRTVTRTGGRSLANGEGGRQRLSLANLRGKAYSTRRDAVYSGGIQRVNMRVAGPVKGGSTKRRVPS